MPLNAVDGRADPAVRRRNARTGVLDRLAGFQRRSNGSSDRPDLTGNVACMRTPGEDERRLLAILDGDRLRRVLRVMLDESEFLSPYGIRASPAHRDHPYCSTSMA